MSVPAFWLLVATGIVGAGVIVYMSFGHALQFVGSEGVREQRLQARETFATLPLSSILVGYSMIYPATAFNPLVLAYGLTRRRLLWVAVGTAGQLYAYMVNAARGPVASLLVIMVLYVAIRQRKMSFSGFWAWFLAAVALTGALVNWIPVSSLQVEVSWLISRTLVMPGYLTGVYHDFFDANPQTLFSHVRGFGWITTYPYGDSAIGFVIGDSLGQTGNQANANLWADGFAAWGFKGMFIATGFLGSVFYILDCVSARLDRGIVTMALAAQALNFSDVPAYTAVLGGGLVGLILLFYLAPASLEGLHSDSSSADPARRPKRHARLHGSDARSSTV